MRCQLLVNISFSQVLLLYVIFSVVHADASTLYRRCECTTTKDDNNCFCLRTRNCSAVDYLPFCPQSATLESTVVAECGTYEKCCSVSVLASTYWSCEEETCPRGDGDEDDEGEAVRVYDRCGLWPDRGDGSFHMPWVGILLHRSDSAIAPICGVTVVHPRLVLTAAGCLKRTDEVDHLEVVAGTDMIFQTDNNPYAQRVGVVRAVENVYYSGGEDFDVALLELETSLRRDPGFVDVACLQQPDSKLDLCSCWSVRLKTESGDLAYDTAWKNIKLRVLKHKTCENLFWDFKSEDFILPDGFTCAVGDYGFCWEDYGAPVVCPLVQDRTRFVLAGILAEPPDPCGSPEEPTRLINTGYFSFWIQNTLHDLGYENYAVHPLM